MNPPSCSLSAARVAAHLSACLLALVLAWPAAASEAGAEAAELPLAPATSATALVRLDGRPVVALRGFAGYTAQERAKAMQDRIVEFARQRDVPVSSLQLVDTLRGTEIRAGSQPLVTITDADAALEGLSRPLLASAVLDVLATSVESWREQRTPRRLLRHAGYTLAATLLLALAIRLLTVAFRRLRAMVRARGGKHVPSLNIGSFEVLNAERLRRTAESAVGLVGWLAFLGAGYLYLQFVLPLFPWTRPLGARLLQLVTEPLSTLGLAFVDALPNIVFLVVLFLVVRYVLKLARLFFLAIEHGTVAFQGFEPDWAIPTYKVVRIFIVAFAVVVAYPYIPGSDSAAFKGVSVLLGVIFSLGSSSVISNIIAGYTMTYRRAFRIGDRVQIGDVIGEVVDSKVLVTTLRTPKNELVVVPNSEILGKSVVNYSTLAKDRGLIVHTTVGIGYETPWRQVDAMLRMAADRTPGLSREPAPFVLQRSLGDFCVVYEINAYTPDAGRLPRLYSDLHANILDVFNEYGVQIMTPSYESDTPEPKLVRPGDWYPAPASPPSAPGG